MTTDADWGARCANAVRELLDRRAVRPRATYRLQFSRDQLTFADAARLVPYLDGLGISHVYASPCLRARAGSSHGYDIVDHGRLNPELGSEDDYSAFVESLIAHGMGQILDIVPNHMGIAGGENGWWNDVLENGPSSSFAHYFDIDWRPAKHGLKNRVLLPMLGEQYGEVLESGRLRIEYRDGAFLLKYFETTLPIEPRSTAAVLQFRLDELRAALDPAAEPLTELESILTALDHLPTTTETDPERLAERNREKEVIKGRLRRLTAQVPEIAEFVARNVEIFNGVPDDSRSFDLLDSLLDQQVFRLAHWKAAADEINYRRFFDINELAALCMEEPDVFRDTHRLVFELLVQGRVSGLRIDHVDGLFDPLEYLLRLQQGYLIALGRSAFEAMAPPDAAETPDAGHARPSWEQIEPDFLRAVGWPPGSEPSTSSTGGDASEGLPSPRRSPGRLPLFVIVEKILEHDEGLPREWPVAGTTGYDFLNLVGGLFVHAHGHREIVKTFQQFTNDRTTFADCVYDCKRLILQVSMASELHLLAARVNRLSEEHRRFRDFTLNNLRTAVRELLAAFPVYRTYIREDVVTERDRRVVRLAAAAAKRNNPALDGALFDFVRDALLLEAPPGLDAAAKRMRLVFTGRFQQVAGTITAKGVEDTAFYRCVPLASLNEVGGTPDREPTSIEQFHRENRLRLSSRPASLLCTSTHDTKRSEDVRARIAVLSEIPRPWKSALNRWSRANRRHLQQVEGAAAPCRSDEYLFYQTLLGVWPLNNSGEQLPGLIERIQTYMQKATHEAKRHTSWVSPDPAYDAAVRDFVAAALDETPRNRFLPSFREFHERVIHWGLYTALSQLVLKLTSPGTPDIYQGQEVWDFRLVDPDNRCRVDFDARARLLEEIAPIPFADGQSIREFARRLAMHPRDDRTKLFVTWRILQFRRQHAPLFEAGNYVPLAVTGDKADHLCAFAWHRRRADGSGTDLAVIAVPRLLAGLTPTPETGGPSPPPLGHDVWGDTRIALPDIPIVPLENVLTREWIEFTENGLSVGALLANFPVAVMSGAGQG